VLRLSCSALVFLATASAYAQPVQFEPAPGGDVIVDPELAGQTPPTTEPPASTIAAPSEQSADVRVVLRSRLGIDLEWQDAREDVIEATQLLLMEARIRRSERLAFSIGVRAQHRTLSRERSTPDAGPVRYELDAAPTALYADVGITDEVHTRVGYQGVHLGRFDVLGASDVLSRYDLRSGPMVMPEQSEIAQPAISADWDVAQGYAVRGIYVPFFAPHQIYAFEGDYALVRQRQSDVDQGFDDVVFMQDWRDYAHLWREALSRSAQAELSEGAFSAFAPDPSLGSPQAALRFTAHGPAGEIALTVATALEHLPTLRFDPYEEDPATAEEPIFVPRVRYGRFGLISIDGATDIGPVQLGLEVALTTDRALIATNDQGLTQVRESDILHTALRAELVEGDDLVVALEASCATMLADPADDQDWLFTVERRYQIAAIAFAGYSINAIDLRLELGGGVLVGPTYLITPRAELRLWDQLYGEVGAYIIGGKGSGRLTDPSATLGSMYDDIDQVFAGLRWLI
jgi:hypothetical protein